LDKYTQPPIVSETSAERVRIAGIIIDVGNA